MPNRVPWFERTFTFDAPAGCFPELMERLRGVIPRAEALVRPLSRDYLTRRIDDTWSIQANLAHIADLDRTLFAGRLDDFDGGVTVLRDADLTNALTHATDHDARAIDDVLDSLRREREAIIERLETLAPDDFARTARHPRLDVPMRVIDMLVFHGEHDDYHLARVRELARGSLKR